ILESMRPRLREHRRTTQPWIVARNRSVSIDVHYAPREIAPFVGIVEKRMFHAVQFRLVQPKPVGTGNKKAAIGRHGNPTFANSITDHLKILQTPPVVTKASPGYALAPDLHRSPLRQRRRPHLVVKILKRPGPSGFAHRRREVRKIDHAVSREVRV